MPIYIRLGNLYNIALFSYESIHKCLLNRKPKSFRFHCIVVCWAASFHSVNMFCNLLIINDSPKTAEMCQLPSLCVARALQGQNSMYAWKSLVILPSVGACDALPWYIFFPCFNTDRESSVPPSSAHPRWSQSPVISGARILMMLFLKLQLLFGPSSTLFSALLQLLL